MEKIVIKNIGTANIILSFEDLKFRRELVPGRSLTVDKEMYEEMAFDPGFLSMINEHYLQVTGLDDDDERNTKLFDSSTIAKILDNQDITAFAKFIPTAAPGEKDTVVQLAVQKKVTNNAIVSLIKKYCDFDVMEAIHAQYQAEE